MLPSWKCFLDSTWKLNSECNTGTKHSKLQCHIGKNIPPLKSILFGGMYFINYFIFSVNIVQFCEIKIRMYLRHKSAIDKVFLLRVWKSHLQMERLRNFATIEIHDIKKQTYQNIMGYELCSTQRQRMYKVS